MTAKIYNIPSGLSPTDILAEVLAAPNPAAELTETLVLLPNRRACRELRDAFVRLNGMQPTLLPRIMPLGDPDEDELFFTGALPEAEKILPAVSPMERILLFTRLISSGQKELTGGGCSPAQAAALATELCRLLDTIESEELPFAALSSLVPEEYAAHWQKTLDFLKIVGEFFPQILAERKSMNPAARQCLLLKKQAAAWQAVPPRGRVVVAGTTGAFPAMRELIKTVFNMPLGTVFINGLDRCLDDFSWQLIDETHPQYELRLLLDFLGLSREEIPDVRPSPSPGREKFVSEVMRPAATTDQWRNINRETFSKDDLNGVHLVDCRDFREEALAVAALMRHTLETPEKTAALVTGNRDLARHVSAELRRWDINVDDSAGRPLTQTPVGIFLRLITEYCQNTENNIALLALCKHPLAGCGYKKAAFRSSVRAYEKDVLRRRKNNPAAAEIIKSAKDKLSPLTELYNRQTASFADLLAAHLKAAEAFAADETGTGASNLWRGDDGEAAASFFASLMEHADALPQMETNRYGDFVSSLMTGIPVRPKYGTHPRLKILGPIEARLSGFDTVIIGEVNEGCWPAAAAADAWMSRPMKKDFGYPLPERKIGVNAGDFAGLLAQKNVYLTRADRVNDTPMNKSRWWLRMETVLTAAGINPEQMRDDFYRQTAAFLDRPQKYKPLQPPAPKPPLKLRPRELWAGAVENLMRDPYIVFAKYILKLEPLKKIDDRPGIVDLGIIVHTVLEKFNRRFPEQLPDNAADILAQIGKEELAAAGLDRQTLAFWQPQMDKIVNWVLKKENSYRTDISRVYCETVGHYSFETSGGTFTLSARADRIDITKDGQINIIDYKSGRARSKKEVNVGYAPQLPIEGIIAENGGFENIPAAKVKSLRYWRLGNEEICINDKVADILRRNLNNIKNLIDVFDNEEKAYLTQPNPKYAPTYSDYEHLSRIKEWGVIENNDD